MFFLETALGQYTSQGGVTAWRRLCPLFEGELDVMGPVVTPSLAVLSQSHLMGGAIMKKEFHVLPIGRMSTTVKAESSSPGPEITD